MKFSIDIICATLLAIAVLSKTGSCHEIKLKNNCGQSLKVFSLENGAGKSKEIWDVDDGQEISKGIPQGWGGRFWARYADVGELQGWPQPDSLAEIKFDGYMGLDFYDISLVDGFGVPLRMTPIDGTFEKNQADGRSCKSIDCQADLIAGCPEELELRQDDRVVACQSACTKFHSDEYCCKGAYDKPETCPSTHFSRIFKDACPDAYSYAYDDGSSTFTCKSAPGASSAYKVDFC